MKHKCESSNFAPAKLRLIPKGETFRPIMTFNRKIPHSKNQTTNKKLGKAHLMLKCLKQKMTNTHFGFSVFNYDDIMKRYEDFVNRWEAQGKPKIYFVTMDIEKCYDSVGSKKLGEFLLKTDLLDKEYFMLNCIVLKRKNNVLSDGKIVKEPFKNHFRHKFHKIGVDSQSYPTLFEVMSKENDYNFKRALIVEHEHRKKLMKAEMLNQVNYIIHNNYITFNKK